MSGRRGAFAVVGMHRSIRLNARPLVILVIEAPAQGHHETHSRECEEYDRNE